MSELIECLDGLTAEDIMRRIAKTANGQPFYLQTQGLSGGYEATCVEYQAIYDAYTTKPDDADAALDDALVCGLVAAGLWTRIDAFWMFANHINTDGECLHNWKDPSGLKAVAYNNPTFVQWSHVVGGANEYIDLNWKPSNGVNYQLDDASIFWGSRNDVVEIAFEARCVDGAGNRTGTNYYSGGRIYSGINTASEGFNIKAWTTRQYGQAYRNTNANTKIRSNTGQSMNSANASTSRPNANLYALATNNNGVAQNFTTKQVIFIAVADYFDDADFLTLYSAIETRMDAHGTGIIP